MTNKFSERIINIEAQLNKLKTLGIMSSSSLGVSSIDIVIPFQIIATRVVSGEVLDCYSSKYANINLRTNDGSAALFSIEFISPNLENRRMIQWDWISEESGYQYNHRILIEGNDADLAALNRGETLPTVNYTFRIKMTSLFSYYIKYTDVEID